MSLRFALVVCGLLAALSGTAIGQTSKQIIVEGSGGQPALKPAEPAQALGDIAIELDRADATYGLGETVRMSVRTSFDTHLVVLNIGASGKITQLYPNVGQKDARIKAGARLAIPAEGSGVQIRVAGPVGEETIKVIATPNPITLAGDEGFKAAGQFRTIDRTPEALARDLEVVAANQQPAGRVLVVERKLRTVPARVADNAPAAVTAPAPFPLLLATDRTSYRVGEPIIVGVTPFSACHLVVMSEDSRGQMRQVFPQRVGDGPVAALAAAIVSGRDGRSLTAREPGTLTLTAFCGADGGLASATIRGGEGTVSPEDRVAFNRDLDRVTGDGKTIYGYARRTVEVKR